MENNYPEGWKEVLFTDVFDIQGGSQPPKNTFVYEPTPGYIRLLQIRDFGEKPVPTFITRRKQNKICTENDILIARYGASLGRIVTGMSGAYNVALAKVLIPDGIERSFVKYLLKSDLFQKPILLNERSAQDGFNKDDLAEIKIPIPPLYEQHRIATKLDALFEKIEANQRRLERVPQIMQRFKQSIIDAAINGDFLKYDLKFLRLGELINDIKYGTTKKCDKTNEGIAVLRIPNIGMDGKIVTNDLKYTILQQNDYNKLRIEEGDLLMIRSNGSVSLLGRTAIVSHKEVGYAYAGYLMRIKCDKTKLLPAYLNYVLSSTDLRQQIEIPSRSSSGVNNINSNEVKALKIPYYSVDQQLMIINHIEGLLSFAKRIEERYFKAQTIANKLSHLILFKAFHGELVSQNPDDEPASVLLESIKTQGTKTQNRNKMESDKCQ